MGVDNNEIRIALAHGNPVAFGVSVFDSFFNGNGHVPMPSYSDAYLGGHAMALVGYNDDPRRYTFLNSWGTSWGVEGYGTIPYEYVGNPRLGSDYWILNDELYKERM